MAINKKLIHFKTKQKFNEELANGNILETSIVFILDTTEIYTHGQLYDGSTFDPTDIEASILNIIDTKANKSDVEVEIEAPNGVYAVTANGELIDYHTADSSCIGVAFISANQKVMIPKANATDGTNTTLLWGYNLSGQDVPNLEYLADATAAKADYNGKANTAAIIAGYAALGKDMDSRDMCKVLETYNEGGYTDWYVPAAGQLYEFYSNKAALNEALAAISGTAFASHYYWSSSEESVYSAWLVVFNDDNVLNGGKYSRRFVRFVRDLTKPLKEKIIELEDNIPTKLSQLENDSNYIQDDVVSDGVYAVDTNGKLINYNTADSSCLGVALIAGEHKFMIAKSDATDGTSTKLYWTYNTSDLSLTNYSKVDGTNDYGYLPKPDGTFGGSSSAAHLSDDFTTWTNGALSDFNGKDNTAIIAAASSDAGEMCTVLNTFKASDSHNDWYVPACGQLALMYLNMTEINAALAKIGGTALAAELYWSSSEGSSDVAWSVRSNNGYVSYSNKNSLYRVRFVRDISVPKPLKERVSDLESNKQDKLVSGTNIKTINGESILGEGNIVVEVNASDLSDYVTKDELSNVAVSGSYNDLTNKPTIPTAVTESTVSGWGFTKNTGTVTGVKVNGSTKNPSSGIVDLGTVITAVDSSMSSTSTNTVQNKVIKSYIDNNCNIPTLSTTASSISLTANKYCRWTNTPTSITIKLATPSNTSILNNYMFEFTASSSGCTLSVPSTIKWINGTAPSIEAGKTYLISIINNLATVAKFS